MTHEVYISYDDTDKVLSDAICHALEENKIKCWIRSRDFRRSDDIEDVIRAIRDSKLMLLVYSKRSKESDFIKTEVDIAFSSNLQILIVRLDNSEVDGALEFFLKNKHWLDAYPKSDEKFKTIVKDTSILLEKPISEPIISQETIKPIEVKLQEAIERKSKKKQRKIAYIIIGLIPIVLLIISGILYFAFVDSHDTGIPTVFDLMTLASLLMIIIIWPILVIYWKR